MDSNHIETQRVTRAQAFTNSQRVPVTCPTGDESLHHPHPDQWPEDTDFNPEWMKTLDIVPESLTVEQGPKN